MRKYLYIILSFVTLAAVGQSSYSFELAQKVSGNYVFVEINVTKQQGEDIYLGSCNLPFVEENGVLDLENAILVDSLMGIFSSKYDEASYSGQGFLSKEFVHVMILRNVEGSGMGALVSDVKQSVSTVAIPIKDPCGESSVQWLDRKAAVYTMGQKKLKTSVEFKTSQPLKISPTPEKPTLTLDDGLITASKEGLEWYLDGEKIEGIDTKTFKPSIPGDYMVAADNGCEKSFSDPLKVSEVTSVEEFVKSNPTLSVSPNPFVGSTNIAYNVTENSEVLIEVFDILGNKLETLINGRKDKGLYHVEYLGGLTSSEGVYIIKMKIGEEVFTKRVVELGNNG